MTTLSLETSKKIFKLVGEYETEKVYAWPKVTVNGDPNNQISKMLQGLSDWSPEMAELIPKTFKAWARRIPAPTFAELIRILPDITKRLQDLRGDFNSFVSSNEIVDLYTYAPSDPEAMAQVEEYLNELL